ncbi:MAG TPA: hypothetical protein VEX57_09375 [Microlunatus sp.]|jgi:hypothetical protein|nr:hypothetical protein [Microlunatus sp.]
MPQTAGDQILQPLRGWGVRRVVGCAGDGINGILAGVISELAEVLPARRRT